MTTKYVLIISLGLILLSLFSCTRNNGGESQLYGQWKLQRIVIDGKEDTDYQGNMFWKFQNKTIEMLLVTQEHDQVHSFGNYRLTDNTLFLEFPDENMPPLVNIPRQCEMQVVRLKGKEMVLATGNPATMYYFKKW